MKVLISGSSGYLGRIAVSYLAARGFEIIGIDICKSESRNAGELFRFYTCNTTDRKSVREIFACEQPDAVLDFACTMNRVRSRSMEFDMDVGGSYNLIEVSRQTASVRKFIYSSSAAIYGPAGRKEPCLDETVALRPGKYRYGINKRLVEQMLSPGNGNNQMRTVALRICTVVGPQYSKPKSVVSILLRLPFLPASFRHTRVQFLHEDDFTELIGLVLEDENIEGIFNLAPDSCTVVGDVVDAARFYRFPCSALQPVMWVLWNLRLLNLQPAGLGYCLYPVVLDPSRLVCRYNYRFRYTSTESFLLTKENNSLPAGARF
jgi:nucleoside-diphosphate-sugar epimerase